MMISIKRVSLAAPQCLLVGLVMFPSQGMAHWGHVGELAGHGHLIAVGLGAAAVIVGVGVALWGRDEDQSSDDAADAIDRQAETVDEGDKAHA